METKAVRFYGDRLSLDAFELPAIKDDEILARVVTDTLCLSTYKAVKQGKEHIRIPKSVSEKPIIIGHEFCGEILEVGSKWRNSFSPNEKFILQPALNYKGSPFAPGYSYQYLGGSATFVIIPKEVMEMGCLLKYEGDSCFSGCLAEPMSCIIGGFKKMFHTQPGSYELKIDIKQGGQLLILGGAGPMGIGTIDYAMKRNIKPRKIVVVDNVQEKLDRASSIATIEVARENGVGLEYLNVAGLSLSEQREFLLKASENGGFDDIFIYAAVRDLVELGDELLAHDGCMNLFAGPYDNGFKSEINFYNVHYKNTHMVGLSGGTTQDMIEYLRMVEAGIMNPQVLITHIGGLNCVADTIIDLPATPGGKKLIYNNINLELTALSDFAEKGKTDPLFAQLAELIEKTNGLWNKEAEEYLLQNFPKI